MLLSIQREEMQVRSPVRVPPGALVVAEFDNPENPACPVIVELPITGMHTVCA